MCDIPLLREGSSPLSGEVGATLPPLYSIQIWHASVGTLMECLPEGGWFSRGWRHSIRIPTLAWHICFIIPNKPQFGKISMKTTMTASRSSENGGRFAGGHFAGGHDGMANLCKPITA